MSTSDGSNVDEPLATVTFEVRDHAVCATVRGEIDMSNTQQVIGSLLAAVDGLPHLTVDLGAVDFMDSRALAGLHQLWLELTETGRGLLIVTGRDSAAERTLMLSGMDQVLPLHPEPVDRRPS